MGGKETTVDYLLGLSLFIMTACATNGTASDITADSMRLFGANSVYFFLLEIIRFLSFDISIGVGLSLHDFDPDDSTGLDTDGCL